LETTIQGASSLIVNFRGGDDLTLDEVTTGVDLVRQVISPDANVLFGVGFDENMTDEVQVTLIATGFSGGNDSKAAFFSSETATNVQASALKRNSVTTESPLSTGAVIPPQPATKPVITQPADTSTIAGTIPVDDDPSIPPFLRKMRS
jgi:cell division protein FtsZ